MLSGENGEKLTSDEHCTRKKCKRSIKLAKALHINLVPKLIHQARPAHLLRSIELDVQETNSARKHNVKTMYDVGLGCKYEETLAFC